MPNVFTGQEFARQLAQGKLNEPIIKIGMVKKPDDSSNTILFAESGCDDWVSIPISFMEQVTFLRNVPCRDHRHPLVMIQLKEPEPGNESASVYAALARRNMPMTSSPTSPAMASGLGMMPGMGMGPGMTPGVTPGMVPGTGIGPGMGTGMIPGMQARPAGGGGPGGGHGGLVCIVWHTVCGWTTLYIASLGINIPFYACWDVCDTWGLP